MQRTTRLAWRVAGVSLATACAAILAVSFLTPLKTVVPVVIRVDNSTGMVDIVTTLKDTVSTYDEAVNKYFIAKYVTARESYSPATRNFLYRTVGLMSASAQAQLYGEWYRQSPLVVYGDLASAAIEIKNISFVDKNLALVRFSKTVSRGTEKSVTHWAATMSFQYLRGATMSAEDRLINPKIKSLEGGLGETFPKVFPNTLSSTTKSS